MRRILVTGANKGIGRALVERILEEHDDAFVYLGARSEARGQVAVDAVVEAHPGAAGRVELLPLDVASDDAVKAAAARAEGPLYGLVNNAGIGRGASLRAMLETNTRGVRRVCEAFLPMLDPEGGRVVNVTSASGPMFVSRCSPERRAQLVDPAIGVEGIEAIIEEALAIEQESGQFAAHGLGSGDAYGLSKALANAYTQVLARAHPELRINACTPGHVATDMTLPSGVSRSPAEMGMKTPREGASAPLFLLFGAPEGSGRYYGSDAQRSPLDRYRSPGDPPYAGD
jgi:NAD(P)-dependent dehydrogenase (short-subunit alcohol dehydrogenase family)